MNLQQAKLNFLNNNPHSRILGRYRASEIYSIRKGYKKPEDYFKPDPITRNEDIILRGMAMEAMLAEILAGPNCKCGETQPKYEIPISEGVVIVCKPDFEWESEVWETKYPQNPTYEIPEKWKDQLECEYRATNKQVKLGIFSEPFGLILYDYKPSDKRWEKIKELVLDYHNKISSPIVG